MKKRRKGFLFHFYFGGNQDGIHGPPSKSSFRDPAAETKIIVLHPSFPILEQELKKNLNNCCSVGSELFIVTTLIQFQASPHNRR